MSHKPEPFPRKALIAVAALIAFSVLATAAARLAGLSPHQAEPSPEVLAMDLRFEDRPDGAVLVRNASDGALVGTLPPRSNGFVRGVLRSLVRERHSRELGSESPFRLARLADGRLTLSDPSTGQTIELDAFGPTNRDAFAALLPAADRIAAH